MIKTQITAIGDSAINTKDPLIILFGEQATEELRKVSVIQKTVSIEKKIDLHPGGTVTFGEQVYSIQHVGSLANANFNSIGHITLIFSELPEDKEDRIENGVYLMPHELPILSVGTEISIQE